MYSAICYGVDGRNRARALIRHCRDGAHSSPCRRRVEPWITVEWFNERRYKRRVHHKYYRHPNISCACCRSIRSQNHRPNRRRRVNRPKTIRRCRVSPFCSMRWFVRWVGRVIRASRTDYLFWLVRTATTSAMVRSRSSPFSWVFRRYFFLRQVQKRVKAVD